MIAETHGRGLVAPVLPTIATLRTLIRLALALRPVLLGPATRAAIRDFERSLGLAQTGEPSKTLFDSLKEMRGLTAPVIKSDGR